MGSSTHGVCPPRRRRKFGASTQWLSRGATYTSDTPDASDTSDACPAFSFYPNWQREAVVEGASFGVGIGAGVAIGLIVAVTPVGLAIGIVAGGAAAIGVDYGVKRFVGGIYDRWRS